MLSQSRTLAGGVEAHEDVHPRGQGQLVRAENRHQRHRTFTVTEIDQPARGADRQLCVDERKSASALDRGLVRGIEPVVCQVRDELADAN